MFQNKKAQPGKLFFKAKQNKHTYIHSKQTKTTNFKDEPAGIRFALRSGMSQISTTHPN